MSTVGKVLVVLIAIPALIWVYYAAQIARWNAAWGKQLVQVATQIEETEAQTATVIAEIADTKGKIDLALRQLDDALTNQRALLSSLYRAEAGVKETLDRYTLQAASMEAGVEAAARRLEVTNQALANTRNELRAAEIELAELKQVNAQDRGRLSDLRQRFEETLAENRELVDRAKAAATATPAATRASTLTR